jgi:hypothetical protein
MKILFSWIYSSMQWQTYIIIVMVWVKHYLIWYHLVVQSFAGMRWRSGHQVINYVNCRVRTGLENVTSLKKYLNFQISSFLLEKSWNLSKISLNLHKYPWILIWAKQIFIRMFSFCFLSKIIVGIPFGRWFSSPQFLHSDSVLFPVFSVYFSKWWLGVGNCIQSISPVPDIEPQGETRQPTSRDFVLVCMFVCVNQ